MVEPDGEKKRLKKSFKGTESHPQNQHDEKQIKRKMEILLITLIVVFSFWTWKAERASRERHTEINEILTLLKQELQEIRSGVSKEGDTGLNPRLFEIPPDTSGIVEQKNQEISELKKKLGNLEKQLSILRTSLNT